jgi:hypothetical protein
LFDLIPLTVCVGLGIDESYHSNPATVCPDLLALGRKLILGGQAGVSLACLGVFLIGKPLIRLGQI